MIRYPTKRRTGTDACRGERGDGEDVVDAARLQGLFEEGIAEGVTMRIKKEFEDTCLAFDNGAGRIRRCGAP